MVTRLMAMAALLCWGVFTSCKDDIEVGKFDDNSYGVIDEVYCSLLSAEGVVARVAELRADKVASSCYVNLSKPIDKGVDLLLKIDPAVLEAYNQTNTTSFELFPPELVSFTEQGAILIAPGDRKSDPIAITFNPGEELVQGTTYALPLCIEVQTEGVQIAPSAGSCVILVKVLGKIPSTDKGTGIVTIAYVECNSNNPLNAGEWHLAESGKPFFDIVHLFAANINYLEAEGRIGVNLNPNMRRILDNRDKYIRPLQEMGMKVCLTVLGNHDGTGVANLSNEAARAFAADLKAIVDTYGLDGVDYDDEWSDYGKYPLRPGCVERSSMAFSRLCYETKRAMPDKLVTVYYIGAITPNPEVGSYGFNEMIDGMCPGDYVDYSYYAQYGALSEAYTTILGMTRRQWGASSIDVGNSPNLYNLDFVRKNGYGVQVIYDLQTIGNPSSSSYKNHVNTFNTIAKKLYDDTGVVWSGVNHW